MLLYRLLAAARKALNLNSTAECGPAQQEAAGVRKRMRELSMLVHPDKCSLDRAEEVCFCSCRFDGHVGSANGSKLQHQQLPWPQLLQNFWLRTALLSYVFWRAC